MVKLQQIEPGNRVGLIVVLTGAGTGKTTAALGIAVRAAGHRLRVCIVKFMKEGHLAGEIEGLKWLEPLVEYHHPGDREFRVDQGIPFHEPRDNAQSAIGLAREKLLKGWHDIVILDEINKALKLGLVDLPQVLGLLEIKRAETHLVFTGQDAHPDLCALAHTVTEMHEVKHATFQGIELQPGIDY
jgi:cob(I)alamin adenosyltransferase